MATLFVYHSRLPLSGWKGSPRVSLLSGASSMSANLDHNLQSRQLTWWLTFDVTFSRRDITGLMEFVDRMI